MQQKVTIPNKHGNNLVGILHDTGSPQLVVLCHGFRSTKEYRIMVNLAGALEKEGISAFRFDFCGNGESEGTFQICNYSDDVDDLRSVVDYFVGLKRSTIAVLGHSKGGDVALLYASKYHDIPAVINISGRYDLKQGIDEWFGIDIWERLKKDGYIDVKTKTGEVEYRVTEESMMERRNTDMHQACLLIDANCRSLTVYGSADDLVPIEDATEFAKILPNHQLKIIQGANHGYTLHQHELVSAVLPFLKEISTTRSTG
ncbi:uncharacterized protein LOC125193103 isoform X1 [Salvia hispanica]|uniref:uncharacterized protein LOC125193103 isoform X1 n=1 Tax=Salvia hispanica TaxID=49212 RepID=UPI002009228F|nr:uncharacterized protein LOC125193103 isoform X1 [Salvia hispanica]